MTIPPDFWPEVSRLFDEAMDLDPATHPQWLARIATDKPTIAAYLRKLLTAYESGPGVVQLHSPPTGLLAAALATHAPAAMLKANQMVGPYRLIAQLGQGGMASVWLAQQTVNVVRRVALKIPHTGLEDAATGTARFAQERDLLAGLEHPHIARLYDAGVSDDGLPYLAMEWVDGVPITLYADSHKLSVAQRIALFLQVLQAVRHAHARLIIHRDLKPSNILVTSDEQVKLLDFGIAQLLEESAGANAVSNAIYANAMTPQTASPEQLEGQTLATPSDVYSLGVVFYELLTGRRPYELKLNGAEPSAAAFFEALQQVSITPPSHLTLDLDAATARSSTPGKLRQQLRGDLDAIIAMTLQKDPARRYMSVGDLIDDLARHHRHEPVRSHRATHGYRFGRALRRHRTLAVGTVLALLLTTVGVCAVVWEARVARSEAQQATAIKNFLLGVFRSSDPRQASDKPRGQTTARELLDASIGRIERGFATQPALQQELLGVVARIYRELEETPRYLELQERRVALVQSQPDLKAQVEVEAQLNLAEDQSDQLDFERARQHRAAAQRLMHGTALMESALHARWLRLEAEGLYNVPNTFEQRRQLLTLSLHEYGRFAPRDPGRVTALVELGELESDMENFTKAIPYLQQGLQVAQEMEDKNDGESSVIWGQIGYAYLHLGDIAQARSAYQRSLEIARQTYGEQHISFWHPAADIAQMTHLTGDRLGAQALFDQVLKQLPSNRSDNPHAMRVLVTYASCLATEGRAKAALPLLEAGERSIAEHPIDPHELPAIRLILGDVYEQLGRDSDARRVLAAAHDAESRQTEGGKESLMAARERWARFLLTHGAIAEAGRLFDDTLKQDKGRNTVFAVLAQAGLSRVSLEQGHAEQASARAATALDAWASARGVRDNRMGTYIERVQARALLALGQNSQARRLAEHALASSQHDDWPNAPSIVEARALLRQATP